MLLSVPVELSTDHFELMTVAQEHGFVSQQLLQCTRQWPAERFHAVINIMLQEGIVWVDDYEKSIINLFND